MILLKFINKTNVSKALRILIDSSDDKSVTLPVNLRKNGSISAINKQKNVVFFLLHLTSFIFTPYNYLLQKSTKVSN